jgi:hypothetical protein
LKKWKNDRIEDVLEEDGKGATNTIIMGDWNNVIGDQSNGNICGSYGLEIETEEVKCFLNSVTERDLLPLISGLRSLRKGCIPGKLQANNIDISWIIYS